MKEQIFNPSNLGSGFPGATNNQTNVCKGTKLKNLEVMNRLRLRRAFGNSWLVYGKPNGPTPFYEAKVTPFRVAFNAGDRAGTTNNTVRADGPKPPNQITSSSLGRLNGLSLGDNSKVGGNAEWTGNSKFVFDSSDYIRYRKLKAENNNYNDPNLAGSNKSTVFTTLNNVRN